MEKPFKIFIVEDVETQFLIIRDKLVAAFGDMAIILPDKNDQSAHPDNYWFVRAEIYEGHDQNFEKVVSAHSDIDIFIIDNIFKGKGPLGTAFRQYLRSSGYNKNDFYALMVTRTNKNGLFIDPDDWIEGKDIYIQKVKGNYWISKILSHIMTINGLTKRDLKFNAKSKDGQVSSELGERLIRWDNRLEGFGFIIDYIILFLFNAAILLISLMLFYNLGKDFLFKNDKLFSISDDDTLKKAEHIYSFMLPMFILFGFYFYYKNYISINYLSNKIGTPPGNDSTKPMKLTKILFVSSVISYICIRVIVDLFGRTATLIELISSGTLIIILIIYFVFLENDSRKDKDTVDN